MRTGNCRSTVIALIASILICACSKSPTELVEDARARDAKGDLAGAIINTKAAIQQEPNNGAARFLLGQLYNKAFDGASAEKELRKASELGVVEGGRLAVQLGVALRAQGKLQDLLRDIKPSPAFEAEALASIHALRGRAFLGLRQFEDARRSLTAGQQVLASSADVQLLEALLSAYERKFEAALARLEGVLRDHPASFEAWRLKAQILRAQGKDVDALPIYGKLLELHPAYFGALVNRSSLLTKLGRLDEAEKDVQVLLKYYKHRPEGHVQRAQLLLASGRPREALDAIQLALRANPNLPKAQLLAGVINHSLGAQEQAESLLRKYVSDNPNDPAGRIALGTVLLQAKKPEGTLEVVDPLLRSESAHPRSFLLAGDAYAALGKSEKALEWYEKAVAANPNDPAGYIREAWARFQGGDIESGTEALEAAHKLSKEVTLADELLVLTQIKAGKASEAIETAKRMLARSPDSPLAHNMLGVSWMAAKEPRKARDAFEAALQRQPSFFPAVRNLVQLDLAAGDATAARKRLEMLVSREPKNVGALVELAALGPRINATSQDVERWLNAAFAADPQSFEVASLLMDHYLRGKDSKKALELANQLASLLQKDPRTATLIARAQLAAGETNRAVATLARAAGAEQDSPKALIRLATGQIANNEIAAAAATLRKAVRLPSSPIAAWLMLAECEMRLNNVPEAFRIASDLKKQHPAQPDGWILEGDIRTREKKYDLAIAAYEQGIKVRYGVDALNKLYNVFALANRAEEGEKRLESWLKDNPDDVAGRLFTAQVYTKAGKLHDAIRHYEHLVAKRGNDAIVLNNLAWNYKQVGDARALPTAERAYGLAPDNPAVMNTLGAILVDQNQMARGVELLRRAATVQPKSADIRFIYAKALLKSGDKASGRRELERLLAEFPNFSERESVVKALNAAG